MLVWMVGSLEVLHVEDLVYLFELSRVLDLNDGLVRTNVENLLHRKNVSTAFFNVPEDILFSVRRIKLHIGLDLNHVVTECLDIHEVLCEVEVCDILFGKVGFGVD